MDIPLEVAYKNVQKNGTLENLIRSQAAKLDEMCGRIVSCRISIEKPHEGRQRGSPYRVRIVVRIPPGHELVVRRESTKGEVQDPLTKVVIDSFEAMERQVRELVDKQRNHVKAHPQQRMAAIVERLFREEGYGFLRTLDGREVYFHENSVLHDGFERLEIGTGVAFAEVEGEKGPQASTVQVVNKPGAHSGEDNEHAEPPVGEDAL